MSAFGNFLEEQTVKGSNKVLQAIAIAVDKNGNTLFNKASGLEKPWTSDTPITGDSVFWVASCTKLLTQISVLQCVERGLITLDEDVSKTIPEIKPYLEVMVVDTPDFNPWAWWFGDKKELPEFHFEPAKNPITLRQLLTHTSGVTYDAMAPLLAWRLSRGEQPRSNSGDFMNSFAHPLIAQPGTAFNYGGSMDWAGQIVQRLNGDIPLGQYFAKNIFAPLGIKNATFQPDSRPDMKEKIVEMSERQPDGTLAPKEHQSGSNPKDDFGGDGLWTSPNEYIRVLQDIISDESKLLSPKSIDQLFTPQFPADDSRTKTLAEQTFIWAASFGVVGLPQEEQDDIATKIRPALGGVLCVEDAPTILKNTLMWSGLPNLQWWANREKGVAGLFATQTLPYGDKEAQKLSAEFRNELLVKGTK